MDENYANLLVVERLRTISPNVSFSIGLYGDFRRDELIQEVLKGTPVGIETVKSELRLIREMPGLVNRLQDDARVFE